MKSRIHRQAITSYLNIALLLPLLFSNTHIEAQEIVISGQAFTIENDGAKSKYQYEEETFRWAVKNALDSAFGTSVLSNYERLTITEMEGRSVADHIDIRNNYLNTFPNGEWRQEISRDCNEHKDEKGNWWMTCKVTGIARKIESAQVEFIAKTLDGTNSNINETETFSDKEKGFLYFKAPENGYIIVFYDDFKKVQRCIPYINMSDLSLKIEANKEYIFFSEEHSSYLDSTKEDRVDRIQFTTDRPQDYNQFYILFSNKPFSGYLLNPPQDLGDGYKSFSSMSREDFHEWLQKNRLINKDLQVQRLSIIIRGKDL